MEMNANVIKKVQSYEIDILQKIDEICKKHGLEYWGIGGTALGAVRHQGFVRWDDDNDIGMTRWKSAQKKKRCSAALLFL